ncbi:MAG TPA: lipoyl(octanoyl) transferase LipB [Patescibacteria group bacterium]|nr:lipoyl(octanoyl) transferase LipB [Patescibacteria group bacterium]
MERVTMEEHSAPPRSSGRLRARWLGRIAYRDAWVLQQALAAARADGTLAEDQLLLLEHDAVLTLGRNASEAHVLALPGLLAERGIEVLRVERGGEVTFHGPGQLVAYPIVSLATLGGPQPGGAAGPVRLLGIRAFVAALEGAMADTCAAAGVAAGSRSGHPGCWVGPETPLPRKIGALGIRVARGVSFHGIALNVTTNLADFDLIDPCGTPGLRSTSIARERARAGIPGADAAAPPTTESVAEAAAVFAPALARRLGLELAGAPGGGDADTVATGAPDPDAGTLRAAGRLAGARR